MSGEVCPSCGVAVTPGYVRCPKCRRPLPRRAARTSMSPEGGTAMETRRRVVWPWYVLGAVAMLVFWRYAIKPEFDDYRRKSGSRSAGDDAGVVEPAPAPVAGTRPPAPIETPTAPAQPAPAAAPNPQVLAGELDHALKRQHLWSTVEVVGDHVDIRSSSCGDAAMRPAVDSAAASFKAAGLTRLRCLEQSGTVVFQRGL